MSRGIFIADIKKNTRNKDNFIWHCPNLDCKTKGIVLFKTQSPYLGNGEIECSTCGKLYTFRQIMKENKRNIELYLAKIGR